MIRLIINIASSKLYFYLNKRRNWFLTNFLFNTIHAIENRETNLYGKIKTILYILGLDYLVHKPRCSSPTYVEKNFLNYILDKIDPPKVILDLGSQHLMQSIEFFKAFPNAKIYAFECNPPHIKNCIMNSQYYKNIEVVPKAVYNKNGKLKFFPVIKGNSAASSLFKISKEFQQAVSQLPQKEIVVKATRIDTWAKKKGIKKIDLCWLDLQGAEYEALEGMGDLLDDVQALFVEVEFKEMCIGQKLIKEVKNFLKKKHFTMIKLLPSELEAEERWDGNAIFLNNYLLVD